MDRMPVVVVVVVDAVDAVAVDAATILPRQHPPELFRTSRISSAVDWARDGAFADLGNWCNCPGSVWRRRTFREIGVVVAAAVRRCC